MQKPDFSENVRGATFFGAFAKVPGNWTEQDFKVGAGGMGITAAAMDFTKGRLVTAPLALRSFATPLLT